MINAIAFDLWETLITDTPGRSRRVERRRLERMEEILSAAGFGAAAERIGHAYRALWRRCHELYWSADKDIPCRRQIEHFVEALEIDLSSLDEATLAALEHAYSQAAFEIPPVLVSGALVTLDELKSRGLWIGLICNTGRTPGSVLRQILDLLGIARFIDAMVFSDEHGECKPRWSIFERLRHSLGVAFEEMAFVGDNLYIDIYGAQQCGMRAIHFVPLVRGTAVAPTVTHQMEIVPDGTVEALTDIPALVERLLPAAMSDER